MAIIELKHIKVKFSGKKNNAVDDVSLMVERGDIYGIVGFSGAGKSTLLRTVNLLQKPIAGDITVNGQNFVKNGKQVIRSKNLRLARRKIGMIFQSFNLLQEETILENVAFGLRHAGLNDDQLEQRCLELLQLVDLADKKDAYPSELSGGQQQRVAIARALAGKPDILISDESTSALDPQNTQQILNLLKKLRKEMGVTILLITHEMDVVRQIANKVAVMQNGRIIENGPIREVFLHPQKELTQRFVGGSNDTIATLNSLHLDHLKPNEAIYQLVYSLANVTKSIIIELYQQIGAEASMLYGNVELLNDEAIGTLVILVSGAGSKQKQVVSFLTKKGVKVARLDEKGEEI